jgi:hypothetical protein
MLCGNCRPKVEKTFIVKGLKSRYIFKYSVDTSKIPICFETGLAQVHALRCKIQTCALNLSSSDKDLVKPKLQDRFLYLCNQQSIPVFEFLFSINWYYGMYVWKLLLASMTLD